MTTSNEGTPAFKADCGHIVPALPPNHTGGTGYALTKRYNGEEVKICYRCAGAKIRQDMLADGRGILYLTRTTDNQWSLTDWPNTFAFKPYGLKRGRGFVNGREYQITTGRFTFAGAEWSFRNAGDMQIARCRRLKA